MMETQASTQEIEAELGQTERKLLTSKQIAENIRSAEKWLATGPYANEDARKQQWEKNAKYLRCIWPDMGENDVCVNTIFSNHNTIRPTLYFRNPHIITTPAGPAFQRDNFGNKILDEYGRPALVDNYRSAKLLGVKINHELKEIKFKKTLRKIVGDVIAPYGIGWAKVGYQIITVGGHDADRDTKVSYWVQRVDPRNLVYHWMTTDVDRCLFFAERIIMTRAEAVEDYGFMIPEDYVAKLPDFMKDKSDKVQKGHEDDSIVIAWEYHDMMTKGIYWTLDVPSPDNSLDFPREPSFDPYPYEGASYVPLVFNEDNDDLIGLSDVEPVEDQAKAINRGRTKMQKHIEWYGTRTDYEENSIDQTELDKTKVTDHGVYVKHKEGKLGASRTTPPVPMGQDQYNMDSVHKEDMRQTLGISEYQQGSTGDASTKATTANIVANASIVRIEERRDKIHDFVIEIVRRLTAMIQTFGPEEDYINLSEDALSEDFVEELKKDYGFNPKIPFLRMPKEEIQGEYSHKFNVEDMISQPKEVQFQQWTNFMSMIFSAGELGMESLEQQGVSLKNVISKIAELGGVDLESVKETGPAQISAEKENQMFIGKLEVPDPHKRDHHDEHNLSHNRVKNELETQLSGLQGEISAKMQNAQALQAGGMDPRMQTPNVLMATQQAQQAIQQEMTVLDEQAQVIDMILRRLKLHMQKHEEMRIRKEAPAGQGMPGGQMAAPQGALAQQVDIQSQVS